MDSEYMVRLASLLEESASALRAAAEYQTRIGIEFMPVASQEKVDPEVLSMDIEDLELSVRVMNCFQEANIGTVQELLRFRANQLRELRNFGPMCLQEVREKLAKYGLKIRGDSSR